MAYPIITTDEVILANSFDKSYKPERINLYLPVAQNYINGRLNDEYDYTTHGYEAEYRLAVCKYYRHMTIMDDNTLAIERSGTLGSQESSVRFLTEYEVTRAKENIMNDIEDLLKVILEAMEDEGDDTGEIDEVKVIAGMTFVSVGGNSDYKTNYGDGMRNDDYFLREDNNETEFEGIDE